MFQWSVPCGQNEVYVMSEKCFLVGILNKMTILFFIY